MDDALKPGIKTSEGLLTSITVLTSMVVNILAALNVIDPADTSELAEALATGITAIVTAVVAGLVLVKYFKQRETLKIEAMRLSRTVNG
jgi:ethanolamine transporter EutH